MTAQARDPRADAFGDREGAIDALLRRSQVAAVHVVDGEAVEGGRFLLRIVHLLGEHDRTVPHRAQLVVADPGLPINVLARSTLSDSSRCDRSREARATRRADPVLEVAARLPQRGALRRPATRGLVPLRAVERPLGLDQVVGHDLRRVLHEIGELGGQRGRRRRMEPAPIRRSSESYAASWMSA